MVGDSVDRSTNDSVQFTQFRGNKYRDAVVHGNGVYRLFKVDPVNFPGFKPVALNKDPESVHLGQNLTVVSYGPANSFVPYDYENLTWPGQALEGSFQVTVDPDTQFWAGGTGIGVCAGEYERSGSPFGSLSRLQSHA
jgi:hypothetical protein